MFKPNMRKGSDLSKVRIIRKIRRFGFFSWTEKQLRKETMIGNHASKHSGRLLK
jgi:hypothetical protein